MKLRYLLPLVAASSVATGQTPVSQAAPFVALGGRMTTAEATIAGLGRRTTAAEIKLARTMAIEDLPGITVTTFATAAAARAASGAQQTAAQQNANTAAINAAFAQGRTLTMSGCSRVEIGSSLLFKGGSGIVGVPNDACGKPTIFMPAARFTRADNTYSTRYSANAVGLAIYGQTSGALTPVVGVTISNVTIQSEVADNRNITAIAAVNAKNLTLSSVEIFGLPLGVGINLQSVVASDVISPYIHDFYSNTTQSALVTNAPNATGISVGGDEVARTSSVNGIVCDGVRIINPRIADITTGPAFQAANGGDQSDGINISSALTRGTIVTGFDIRRVAEPIDNFGLYGVFANGYIEDAYNFGFKLIHGASFNQIMNVTIVRAGLAGVVLATTTANEAAVGNTLTNITIQGINADNRWAASDNACVLINDYGSASTISNTSISNLNCSPGPNGKYGWLDASAGSSNFGESVRIDAPGVASGKRVYVAKAAGAVRIVGSTSFVATLN